MRFHFRLITAVKINSPAQKLKQETQSLPKTTFILQLLQVTDYELWCSTCCIPVSAEGARNTDSLRSEDQSHLVPQLVWNYYYTCNIFSKFLFSQCVITSLDAFTYSPNTLVCFSLFHPLFPFTIPQTTTTSISLCSHDLNSKH